MTMSRRQRKLMKSSLKQNTLQENMSQASQHQTIMRQNATGLKKSKNPIRYGLRAKTRQKRKGIRRIPAWNKSLILYEIDNQNARSNCYGAVCDVKARPELKVNKVNDIVS